MNTIVKLLMELWRSRKIILSFAQNDFKQRYAGSIFGVIWGFVQPIFTILIFWFVFQVGFREAPMEDIPFICWLASGLVPWFFFSEAWLSCSNVFFEYHYLVKKVVFKTSILPMVKVLSSLFVHIILVILLIVIYGVYNHYPNVMYLQLIYYSFCIIILTIGLGFITSSVAPFFKDTISILNIIVQFGMWMTPIMWDYKKLNGEFQFMFTINPMNYIVQGYRDTLINETGFWQRPKETIIFWLITLTIFIIGAALYKRLKPHFADVL
ncbi:ABC transporter permease [Clostridium beijerinckii]|uniref:Transport permease protein n=1 Tax=Clostridium beijerinckii TaxID=1520 RepID=A0A1S8SAV0_CLOBE|nr:ABC transporter permease [Clostridium beijerinckii]NRY60538.1 teichoic acid transport system permease protein [Clostridium beijerinckii]OOM62591.1 teichoic acid translocation permease protein TagG [Clostridium beijerinckii]